MLFGGCRAGICHTVLFITAAYYTSFVFIPQRFCNVFPYVLKKAKLCIQGSSSTAWEVQLHVYLTWAIFNFFLLIITKSHKFHNQKVVSGKWECNRFSSLSLFFNKLVPICSNIIHCDCESRELNIFIAIHCWFWPFSDICQLENVVVLSAKDGNVLSPSNEADQIHTVASV